jgi:hypothetical protein
LARTLAPTSMRARVRRRAGLVQQALAAIENALVDVKAGIRNAWRPHPRSAPPVLVALRHLPTAPRPEDRRGFHQGLANRPHLPTPPQDRFTGRHSPRLPRIRARSISTSGSTGVSSPNTKNKQHHYTIRGICPRTFRPRRSLVSQIRRNSCLNATPKIIPFDGIYTRQSRSAGQEAGRFRTASMSPRYRCVLARPVNAIADHDR